MYGTESIELYVFILTSTDFNHNKDEEKRVKIP